MTAPPPAARAPSTTTGAGKGMLAQKLGPFPAWAWLIIITIAAVVVYFYEKNKAGATTGTSSVPDYISQTYVQAPPGSAPPRPPHHRGKPKKRKPGTGGTGRKPVDCPRGFHSEGGKCVRDSKTGSGNPPGKKPGKNQYKIVTVARWTAANPPWNSTLDGIAEKFGVPVDELADLNHIRDPNLIHPGQKIRVPIHGKEK